MAKVLIIDDAYRKAEEIFAQMSQIYGFSPTKEQIAQLAYEIRLERANLTV